MDPLAPFERNEICWCGSKKKYKRCHGDLHPRSTPGEALPPDPEGQFYLSPTTLIDKDALTGQLKADTPITLPPGRPAARPVQISELAAQVLEMEQSNPAPTLADLGRLRCEVLSRIEGDPHGTGVPEGALYLAALTFRAISDRVQQHPRPTVIWNDGIDPLRLFGQVMFLADHVLVPDWVFDSVAKNRGAVSVHKAAQQQLRYKELISAGLVVPVPNNVAMVLRGETAYRLTAEDVQNPKLVDWVKSQLIFEGPTAREAVFVTGKDDIDRWPHFWLHGHIDRESLNKEDRTFGTRLLSPYDPEFDYKPWLSQVTDDAVSFYVQRLNERVAMADVFASEYLVSSPFEARFLSQKEHLLSSAAQAAIWADIPILPDAIPRELARAAQDDEAVEDLRAQVRTALLSARTFEERIDVVTEKAHSINDAAAVLERKMRTDRVWQVVAPGVGALGGLVIGGIAGGIPGVAAGTVSGLASLAPYLAARRNSRREAAYLFVRARRTERSRRR